VERTGVERVIVGGAPDGLGQGHRQAQGAGINAIEQGAVPLVETQGGPWLRRVGWRGRSQGGFGWEVPRRKKKTS